MKKHILTKVLAIVFSGIFIFSVPALAATEYPIDMPYKSYIYNRDNKPLSIPSPYVIDKTITGEDIGVGAFSELTDVYYDGENRLYLTDSGANRIVITDTDYKLLGIISSFQNGMNADSLSSPQSVCVNGGKIYVADSENSRIVVFDSVTLNFSYEIARPEIAVLEDGFVYKPTAVMVDNAGRIYVIAEGINQGLICMDSQGKFTNFLGAPSVEYDFFDLMWRKFTTKKQRKQMKQFVPTEYSKMLIDERGFIYAVAESSTNTPVAKLNSQGNNVLTDLKSESKYGDVNYTTLLGNLSNTHFCDITIDAAKTYYLLDAQKGRIYTYSDDGYLLFVFGASGSQSGTFLSASAIERVGDRILVTDRIKNAIFTFRLTEFGQNVFSALTLYNNGEYDKAAEMWGKVYNTSSNYSLATVGLAKIDIQNGQYKKAMQRVKPIGEYNIYSKAFSKWRNNWMRNNFGYLVAAVVVLIVGCMLAARGLKKKKVFVKITSSKLYKEYKYGTYVMFHPFDGFWDIKRENRGSAKTATLMLVLFALFYAIRSQFTGYSVTKTDVSDKNVIFDVLMVVFPLMLWVVSNWCFTALMSGEGTMKDIYIATCYSLKPYLWFSIPLFICSHFITSDEVMIYTVFDTVCWVWVLAMIFFGMMVTHDYSLSKSVLTLILTLVGICLIVFILLLLSSIVQQVYLFFYNAYKELVFRTY